MLEEMSVKESLSQVRSRIERAMKLRPDALQYITPTLVAVSKTKPIDMILEAYEEGQRHFGENYVQELVSKATDPQIAEKCKEIKWHFIGHIQSNKILKIATLPNLYIIETVDSKKISNLLENVVAKQNRSSRLRIFVQVNTSLETEKNGVLPEQCADLCRYIINECPHLQFCGLMTIGKFGHDPLEGPNPDFLALLDCKRTVHNELDYPENKIELSMGMSDDFEQAIELGSTNVRVGSSIFGVRARKHTSSVSSHEKAEETGLKKMLIEH